MKDIKAFVKTIPDFPKPGIQFRDVTTIVESPEGMRMAVDGIVDMLKDLDFDLIVGSESRGFGDRGGFMRVCSGGRFAHAAGGCEEGEKEGERCGARARCECFGHGATIPAICFTINGRKNDSLIIYRGGSILVWI